MGGTLDYSTTAGSNTTVGGVNIAEGMQAGLVNNGMRAMMADSKKWQLDWSGIVTAGAGNAYTITINQGIAAYADGQRFCFRADRNNTGAATLNVDSLGAKALRKVTGGTLAAVAADDIVAEAVYDVVYDLSSDVFVIVGFAGLQASAFMKTVLDDATAADARTTLGLVIGTDVQAQGATLTSLEGLTLAAGDILYATAADTLTNLGKGTAGQFLRMNSGATAPEWSSATRTYVAPVSMTAVTSVDIATGLPSGVNEFEVSVDGVSSTTGSPVIQLGTSSSYVTTGYVGGSGGDGSLISNGTEGGMAMRIGANGRVYYAVMRCRRVSGDTWVCDHNISDSGNTHVGAGRIVLGGTLTRVRIRQTGTFTAAGSVSLSYAT